MHENDKMARLTAVQAKYATELMAKPHVVGVGIGLMKRDGVYTDEIGLVIMVDEMPPPYQAEADRIPKELEGFPCDVQVTGEIKAD